MYRLRIGSFTAEVGGRGEGIVSVDVRAAADGWTASEARVSRVGSPTFLAGHPTMDLLYAASETPDGRLHVFVPQPDGSLRLRSSVQTAPSPAHLVIGAAGGQLFAVTSHYFGGCFALHRVLEDGSITEPCDVVDRTLPGVDPAGRVSHAHAAVFVDDGRILAADLGHDAVLSYRIDPEAGRLEQLAELSTPPGSGPRHLAPHRDGRVFVSGERDASVLTVRIADNGRRLELEDARSSVGPELDGSRSDTVPAEIALSHDDRFLHVANRGVDRISTFDVADGVLRHLHDVPSGGRSPRHFAIRENDLFVADTDDDVVVPFRIDPVTGLASPVARPIPATSAAFVRIEAV